MNRSRLVASIPTPPLVHIHELCDLLGEFGLADDDLVKKAIRQAQNSHGREIREDGSPYLEGHIYPVTKVLLEYVDDTADQMMAAPHRVASMVLHDAVENDPYFSPKRLFNEFGSDVTKLVLPLRKPDYRLMQGNSVDEQKRVRDLLYFEQIWSTQADAQLLKLSDRWHNFATIHNAPDPDKIRRYIDVTAQYYLQLAYHRSAWHAQKMEDRLRLLDAAGFRNAA